MVAAKQRMSIEEFAEIDEPGHFDLVDGEVWSMSPTKGPHAELLLIVGSLLLEHVRARRLGRVFGGDMGFRLDSATVLCPDVAFVQTNRIPDGGIPAFFDGAPDLAVEVISPSERPSRIQTKVARYLEAGSALVWCVYPETRQVVVYRADDSLPEIVSVGGILSGGHLLPDLQIPLASIFDAYV